MVVWLFAGNDSRTDYCYDQERDEAMKYTLVPSQAKPINGRPRSGFDVVFDNSTVILVDWRNPVAQEACDALNEQYAKGITDPNEAMRVLYYYWGE
jgi:hypothetical protein